MSLFSALSKVLGGNKNLVRLDGTPGAGTAVAAMRLLIADLRQAASREIRSVSTKDYLEAVIRRERLEACSRILGEVFGPPAKPFDQRASFDRPLRRMVESGGGILKNQCLYLRRYEDDRVAFAALWPWADPENITLKVGTYDQELSA